MFKPSKPHFSDLSPLSALPSVRVKHEYLVKEVVGAIITEASYIIRNVCILM